MQPNESRSRFVTVAEVAELLRVSNMTVYRLVQAGQLPAVRVGRSYRIREDDVDRYLAGQYTQAGWRALSAYNDGPPRIISFLSDYGLEDEFVGIVHRVIAAQAPGVRVVDVTHQIPPHDVRTGAMTLWRAAPWLAPGVILAVVDPGVGTDRGAVAVTVGPPGAAGAVLIGPDNGLLPAAAHRLGPVTGAYDLAHHPTGRGATFAGREIFGPVAALIAAGEDPGSFGVLRDPDSLQPSPIPLPLAEPSTDPAHAEVLWVDRFGNAQINVSAHDATWRRDDIQLQAATGEWKVRYAPTYADLEPGELGLVHDSYDLLSVSLYGSSAAEVTGLRPGDMVHLSRQA